MGTRLIIGITGGSGSGKSSLMKALYKSIPSGMADILTQDDYYHPKNKQQKDELGQVNFDLPTALDLDRFARDLRKLRTGRPVHVREYTFNERSRLPRERLVSPAPIILTEGLFLLCDDDIRVELDHTIFVETDPDTQLQRRLARDMQERGYTAEMIEYQWENHVLPAYGEYLLPYRSHCDLCIDNDDLGDAVNELLDFVAMRTGLPVLDDHLL